MKINKYIDHTLLKADAKKEDIKKLCEEAIKHDFKSVCVNPGFVKYAKELLEDSNVLVCTVIGFPLGANTSETKGFETKDAYNNGVDEVDMVINISALKDHDYDYVLNDIKEVVKNASGKTVKVIVETCYLTEQEKEKICKIVLESGADFIKTSTGFGTGGATAEDISLFNKIIQGKIGIKASGGVRNYEDAMLMISNGATRLGTSGGVNIVQGLENKESY